MIGGDGVIGRNLIRALTDRGDVVYGTSRRPDAIKRGLLSLDLSEQNAFDISLPDVDIAFFCAATTRFNECREDPKRSRMVNAIAPVVLGRQLVDAGSRVVLLSTSAVFDWSLPNVPASRPQCPSSVYGKLKAEAEAGFLSMGRQASVIRFAKVIDPSWKLFVDWIDALSRTKLVRAFADLRMAPISLDDALVALLAVADDKNGGIYQYSGANDISYFDAGKYLAQRLGCDPDLVISSLAREAGIPPEEITVFSSLDSSRVARLIGRPAPDSFDVIDSTFGRSISDHVRRRDSS